MIKYERGKAQYFVEDLGNDVELEMVLISGGTFTMGAPENEEGSRDSERPQHQVTVPPFFMGKCPITQTQWEAVAALPKVNHHLTLYPSDFKGYNRPVEQVSWYDAMEFCDRLSQYTNRTYNLPSEAQWEYACRAGTTTPFHFGETITSELANYNANYTYGYGFKGKYCQENTPITSFGVANAFGLYDMHGNIWEWCLDDWHDNYQGAPTDGSAWFDNNYNLARKESKAILRGGSWLNYPQGCRSAYRYNFDRAVYSSRNILIGIGFRVACVFGNNLK